METQSKTCKSPKASGSEMPRLANERLMNLTELTKVMPTISGRRPAISTVWRWCLKGIRGIHLEHLRQGRALATSLEALNRFSAAVADRYVANYQEQEQVNPFPKKHPLTEPLTARERSIAEAKQRLKEAGF